jgi:hypothetical protein
MMEDLPPNILQSVGWQGRGRTATQFFDRIRQGIAPRSTKMMGVKPGLLAAVGHLAARATNSEKRFDQIEDLVMATAMAIQISQRPPTGVDRPEPVCCSTLGIAC